MEKLSNKKFHPDQILNEQQSQSIFGGWIYRTVWASAPYAGHCDMWDDINKDGRMNQGDTIEIELFPTPPPPGSTPVPYSAQDLANRGVVVSYS